MNKLVVILLIAVAVFLAIVSYHFVPSKHFAPNYLELDSTWIKTENEQEYIVDLDGDGVAEYIQHHNINRSGHSIQNQKGNSIETRYIFRENEFFASEELYFADINGDGIKEGLFISVLEDCANIVILCNDDRKNRLVPIDTIPIDTIKNYNNMPDVTNYDIITYRSEIYFDLHAGYKIQPRHIYKYNYANKILTKDITNAITSQGFKHFIYNGQEYLLLTDVKATGNTLKKEELAPFKNADDKDSLALYNRYHHFIYQYGDFSSYILLYDNNLDFAFEPIEFFKWTNVTKTDLIFDNETAYIIAFTNNSRSAEDSSSTIKEDISKVITLCDLQGNIKKQIPMPHDFIDLFVNDGKVVFYDKQKLYEYSINLEKKSELENITSANGFYDLNGDGKKEFIAYENNKLMVFSDKLKIITTFNIIQEYHPYPENGDITLLQLDGKQCFFFNSRLNYYIFSYHHNKYAFLKYPFLILLFVFWFGFLLLIVKYNSRRLEKEKEQLEQLVIERTKELDQKNKHLQELNNIKQILTGTIVHDLKNPLGQIITTTKNKTVNNLAKRMLLLISNLLDINKYEETDFLLEKTTHSLNEIIKEAIDCQQINLQEKNIKVTLTIDNLTVNADKNVIIRILENLLSNAIRFSPQNNIIEIDANYNDNKTVTITITNHGEAIAESAIDHIFEKYAQAKKVNTSSYRTTGLGLTFCKMAIEAHGHSIKAENTENGVCFSFQLDGDKNNSTVIQVSHSQNTTILTNEEKEQLIPWLEQLKNYTIYQISDINNLLNQIPDSSKNIVTHKQQISNAVFASNEKLFFSLINV